MIQSLIRVALLTTIAAPPVAAYARPAPAIRTFNLEAQTASTGIMLFARQAGIQIMMSADDGRRFRTAAVKGRMTVADGLKRLLAPTGLRVASFDGQTATIVLAVSNTSQEDLSKVASASDTQPNIDNQEDIIVTAQKRKERLQDVPVAVSAFQAKSLDDHKIEGGSELLRAVPNVNFSKGNFSMYNFSIRGIGTKAISASSDPAVAVSFNNTPLIRNRLFEQEFFDIDRVEVLRGPQGTLYGRNATGGVVNILPTLPTGTLEGEVKVETGNYGSMRASGMINIPLAPTFAIRAAGAMTKRDGFDYNSFTDRHINGRDLWSTRVSAEWKPGDRFKANFIWQHFNEADDRSRTGKQLCTRDPGPSSLGGVALSTTLAGRLSQGCLPGSLYDNAAYGAPNAAGFANIYVLTAVGLGFVPGGTALGANVSAVSPNVDPYAGITQSRDLREVATAYDPVFRAKNDIFQLNLEAKVGDNITVVSQTAYAKDYYYSSQDYNRYVSNPIFNDSEGLNNVFNNPQAGLGSAPGGIFTDPQLGASDRMLAIDINRSKNDQWTQEFRIQSDFSGPFNFNIGGNYLFFKSQDDYYVLNNTFTYLAQYFYDVDLNNYENAIGTQYCPPNTVDRECIYVDPHSIGRLDDQGHNYFLSRNIVRTRSWAGFGEVYWRLKDNLKLTLGLRYTDDQKRTVPVPSQLLLGSGGELGGATGGYVSSGYPTLPDIVQHWGRFSGRAVLDWKPNLSFTDNTLVYLSYSNGYKGGGSNPPRIDINPAVIQYLPLAETYKPEFVNSFEIGMKNSLDGGRLTLNATAFFSDYKDYQVSQIVDRISLNENFSAQTWGFELEGAWKPSRHFQLDGNFGYLGTRIKDGAKSIDVMDRTQGNPDWMVVRPWLQVPSNCIAPTKYVTTIATSPYDDGTKTLMLAALCNGSSRTGSWSPSVGLGIPWYLFPGVNSINYNPLTDAPNGGRGFYADLGGHQLPNAPHFTVNIGGQYSFFLDSWRLTFRGDYYRQSDSYARVYNTAYDKLKGWDNVNLTLSLDRPESELKFQLYVKNLFNSTPITDTFTNSDDTGLTANIFTLDPRIIGFSMSKHF